MQSQIESSKRPKLSEVMTPSELFNFAHSSHKKWLKERPLMERFNHSGLGVTLDLLTAEIAELNGGDAEGVFATTIIKDDHQRREDYRQQEVSDIIVFVMSASDELGQTIDIDSIYSRAAELSSEYGFGLASPDETTFPPQAMEVGENTTYGLLKDALNKHADVVSQYDVETGDRGQLTTALEGILIHSIAMHSIMGVNSSQAVLEKVERNHIKYPAHAFQLTEEEKKMADDELGEKYDDKRKWSGKNYANPPENKLEKEARTGNERYYYPKAIEFEHKDVRPMGIWYRAAAQIIATSYGFSAKVSELLNRNKKK